MEVNWPVMLNFASGLLLIIGGVGAFLENRQLKKRIAELEAALLKAEE